MADDETLTRLFEAAKSVRDRAHAPYSNFSVGVALMSDTGSVYTGCNIENASYPEGWCAETSAIAHMVVAGDRKIRDIVVVAGGERLCTPCGGCRQRIAEFATETTRIHAASLDGIEKSFSMAELLPDAFVLRDETETNT